MQDEILRILSDPSISEEDKREAALAFLRRYPSVYDKVKDKPLEAIREAIYERIYGATAVDPRVYQLPTEEFLRLLEERDPATGRPYTIPLLVPTDPLYPDKYVSYMLMKEERPDLFQAILNWE